MNELVGWVVGTVASLVGMAGNIGGLVGAGVGSVVLLVAWACYLRR